MHSVLYSASVVMYGLTAALAQVDSRSKTGIPADDRDKNIVELPIMGQISRLSSEREEDDGKALGTTRRKTI